MTARKALKVVMFAFSLITLANVNAAAVSFSASPAMCASPPFISFEVQDDDDKKGGKRSAASDKKGAGKSAESSKSLDDPASNKTKGAEKNKPTTGLSPAKTDDPTSKPATAGTPEQTMSPSPAPTSPTDEGWFDFLPSWTTILYFVLALLAIGLLGFAITTFIGKAQDILTSHFGIVARRQSELADKMEASVKALAVLDTRLAELKGEITTLRSNLTLDRQEILEGVRKSNSMAITNTGYSTQAMTKEDAFSFPISVEEYLGKVQRDALVVKPDFQNDVLIQDPEGVLMLVQDFSAPDGLIYIVPKVTYFQTRADFHNFYEQYYDCHRPTSGEVWIVEPAVVYKVSGGWKLREKGQLEVK